MTYYLGKVGRAGSRILSYTKDLYNDVNAAYLTGAVDIVVIRQKDGSLKSTPFHVRFGKLGVLRTGDLKEVEVEINGQVVDLHMKVDASGRGFFSKKKQSESISESDLDTERSHTSIDIEPPLSQSPDPYSLSHDSHVTHSTPATPLVHHPPTYKQQSEPLIVVNDQTPPKSEGSESETRTEEDSPSKQQDTNGLGTPAAVNKEQSETFLPALSPPIAMEKRSDVEGIVSSSLHRDIDVMSDSGLDQQRTGSLHADTGHSAQSALSDTEVEIKDRLSSKLWEWSAPGRRKRQTSLGEPSTGAHTELLEDGFKERFTPQPASVDRAGFWSALTGIISRRGTQRQAATEDGIYLHDIDCDSMDPDELSKFFPTSASSEVTGTADHTGSSGLGSSPTLSPSQSNYEMRTEENSKLISLLDNCAFSLCGGLDQRTITEELFQSAVVSYADFAADPASLFTNPNLVVRVNGKYYNWQMASALVLSSVVYLQVPSDTAQEALTQKLMPKPKHKPQKSSWLFWRNRWSKEEDDDLQSKAKSEGSTPIGSPRKWDPSEDVICEGRGRSDSVMSDSSRTDILSSDDEQETTRQPARPRQRSLRKKRMASVTSEQLASLPLKSGANTVVFSITTKYQGTTKAQCTLYLWNYFDKIVVSDIDGTITRSDVAGQVLPLLGKDWTQNGVVELFGSINRNGYHIIYLSARAIGQAGYTKEFLRNVKRGSCSLPDGPLFLAPFSLYIAFKKEVIEKKPEEFKIECLQQIRDLFPEDFNPFHAGFGNKPSDALSYVKVKIPESRIFTVNHKGHLKHKLSRTFSSNYMDLISFVDAQFPPNKYTEPSSQEETDSGTTSCSEVEIESCNIKEDFNTFNYWKDPTDLSLYLPDLDIP